MTSNVIIQKTFCFRRLPPLAEQRQVPIKDIKPMISRTKLQNLTSEKLEHATNDYVDLLHLCW